MERERGRGEGRRRRTRRRRRKGSTVPYLQVLVLWQLVGKMYSLHNKITQR